MTVSPTAACNNPHWGLAIFASRESVTVLNQTLHAARQAAPAGTHIDVLVNGNAQLASSLAAALAQQDIDPAKAGGGPTLRIWSIPLADKANAWNQYIHHIWSGETIAFFIDGYVRLNPNAISLLGQAVAANPLALGGSGVPTMGRSAQALRQDLIQNIGYHGNFCCIKGETLQHMRDQQVRLPLGLYRTDSLMGAILSYALDPSKNVWEDHRIHVHPTASWQIEPARWWRVQDLWAYGRRYLRQMRGKLENAAFTDHLVNQLRHPAELPASAKALVLDWVQRCPNDYRQLARQHPLVPYALQSVRNTPDLTGTLEPRCLWPDEADTPA